MQCPFCEHPKTHKHGRTGKGVQRFKCPLCHQTFTDTIATLYYRRQLTPEEVHTILQSHCQGSRLRGVSRISQRAYGTVVTIIRKASEKAQMVHNQEVHSVDTDRVESDELWSFVKKSKNTFYQKKLTVETVGLE